MDSFPLISVVIIGYKRAELLRRTVESFLEATSYPRERLELILADDGSPAEMQAQMRLLPFDVFCFARRNGGLGANANQGLRAAKGEYILQLQDDWFCNGPSDFLQRSLQVFARHSDVGLVRFRSLDRELPHEVRHTDDGSEVKVYGNIPRDRTELTNAFPYTDNPHIKSRAFIERIGLYLAGVPMTKTEIDMSRRIACQQQYKVAYMVSPEVFSHIGDAHSFNPCHRRHRMRQSLLANPLTCIPMKLIISARRLAKKIGGRKSHEVN